MELEQNCKDPAVFVQWYLTEYIIKLVCWLVSSLCFFPFFSIIYLVDLCVV